MANDIQVVEATAGDGETVGGMVHDLLVEPFPESTDEFDRAKMCRAAATLLGDDTGVWGSWRGPRTASRSAC